MISEQLRPEQLRLLSREALITVEPSLSQEAERGEPVAKFLDKWGMSAAMPYFIYGVYSGFAEQWWPNGLGLMATGAALYGVYGHFYERYKKKPEVEKFAIRKKIADLQKIFGRRPKVSWE